MSMRLLDLFCGAGGAARGYHDAGFSEIVGVDNRPQPNYPYEFILADAMTFPLDGFDLIHASPPCQRFSNMSKRTGYAGRHPDLIAAIRHRLAPVVPNQQTLYVIENVIGAPLVDPLMLCGSTFNLRVRRHRLFETNFDFITRPCEHFWQAADPIFDLYQHGSWYKSGIVHVFGRGGGKGREHWPEAMGIAWMNDAEIVEAIPPAYTKWIGEAAIAYLGER